MAERRYDDKEIAAVPRDEGLTLADLQAIGGEVGIPAEAIAHAAQALDVRRVAQPPNRPAGSPPD